MVKSSTGTIGIRSALSWNSSRVFGLLLLFIMAVPAQSNSLQDVTYAALSGDRVEIVLTTSEAVTSPTSFATDNPARISIDLPDTTSALKNKNRMIGQGSVRSLTAIEAKDRTRVVVNLLSATPHTMEAQGNKIIIRIGSGGGKSAGLVSAQTAGDGGSSGEISKIDFRRGPDGEGRVEIGLTDPSAVVDMRRQGEQIVLDFFDINVPTELSQILDVTDFATPVQEITTRQEGKNVRVSIKATGDYEHLAYQAGDSYTIEFKPISKQEQETKRRREHVYTGERLSLNFQDIEIRAVLQLLADFTGLNMVISDSVSGNITLRLKNVPWDQAMDIILKTKGLSMRKTDNVILVAPTEEIAAREKLELESQIQIEELAPLYTELIEIKYAKASDLETLLTEASGEGDNNSSGGGDNNANTLLTSRGSVTVDERTNTLIILETAERLTQIRELIDQLDVPVRQVMIEARIVTADKSFVKNLGARLGTALATTSGDNFISIGGNQGGTIDPPAGGSINLTVPDPDNPGQTIDVSNISVGANDQFGGSLTQSLGVTATDLLVDLGINGTSGFNLILGKLGTAVLGLELQALQTEGRGEIISSPRVVTSDQTEATIIQGSQIPLIVTDEAGNSTTELTVAALSLSVTPRITPDDRVDMELAVNKDSPALFNGVTGIETRSVTTKVLVDNGETVVLGGVFEKSSSKSIGKTPFFGDLPYVGFLFKKTEKSETEDELLIFITPRILKESLTLLH